jgi:hypothetical protein
MDRPTERRVRWDLVLLVVLLLIAVGFAAIVPPLSLTTGAVYGHF